MEFETPLDTLAEQIAATIPEDEAAEPAAAPKAAQAPEPEELPAASADDAGDETVTDEAQVQSEADTAPETAPAIEPPPGLTEDERAAWDTLPPTAQKIIARRERDRTSELRRGQDEIAVKSKAIEQERLRLQQAADQYVQLATTVDPVIAEGMKTDWAKLRHENPAEYVAKRGDFEDRIANIQNAQQEAQRARAIKEQAEIEAAEAALLKAIPEWQDRSKAKEGMSALRKGAVDLYGYKSEEVDALRDPRATLVLKDALAYRAMKASQAQAVAAIPTKRVVPVPRVVRAGAAQDTTDQADSKVKAIRKQLASTSDLRDRTDLIAAILER